MQQPQRGRHEVYLRWEPVKRNAVWEADHKELPVLVTPPRGAHPVKPWVTVLLDGFSRLVMGWWALSLRPDSATVLAVLRSGLVGSWTTSAARSVGVPDVLRPDGGPEFATTALGRVCAVLGVRLDPTDPYAPHQKGNLIRDGQAHHVPQRDRHVGRPVLKAAHQRDR